MVFITIKNLRVRSLPRIRKMLLSVISVLLTLLPFVSAKITIDGALVCLGKPYPNAEVKLEGTNKQQGSFPNLGTMNSNKDGSFKFTVDKKADVDLYVIVKHKCNYHGKCWKETTRHFSYTAEFEIVPKSYQQLVHSLLRIGKMLISVIDVLLALLPVVSAKITVDGGVSCAGQPYRNAEVSFESTDANEASFTNLGKTRSDMDGNYKFSFTKNADTHLVVVVRHKCHYKGSCWIETRDRIDVADTGPNDYISRSLDLSDETIKLCGMSDALITSPLYTTNTRLPP
ncbi:hypothetical protein Q1695_007108 [Nippostrongylus brasiliensis]|nr:hypothetical protein Q1695_007108 [Nippostrongylus brasiliensis]